MIFQPPVIDFGESGTVYPPAPSYDPNLKIANNPAINAYAHGSELHFNMGWGESFMFQSIDERPYDNVFLRDQSSSTGFTLPSDYEAPGYNYNDAYGNITCKLKHPARWDITPNEIPPFFIDFYPESSDGHAFIHNCINYQFIGANTYAELMALYPGFNAMNGYPLEYPIAIMAVVNPDLTVTNVPMECAVTDDYIELVFTNEMCGLASDDDLRFGRATWIVANRYSE